MDWNWPPEVTVAVIGLLGILLGTIAGGAVSLITTQMNRKDQAAQREQDRKDRAEEARRQEERWQAEFFMKLHVDSLHKSQHELTKLRILLQGTIEPLTPENLNRSLLATSLTSLDHAVIGCIEALTPLMYHLPAEEADSIEALVVSADRLYNNLNTLRNNPKDNTYSKQQ
ncbi:MAG TPA: hypothetical protein VEY08_05570, partial [Chloroflexia bacterium]|nr:hypothetical protein [Chloroflexia bacterium]